MKKRAGEPWMPAAEYGRTLPPLTINLLVGAVPRALEFHRRVLNARVVYADADFAALELGGIAYMLHADHAYDGHPWLAALAGRRGIGVELRVRDVDPAEACARAAACGGQVVRPPRDTGHGWREAMIEDPDGYWWAVGKLI